MSFCRGLTVGQRTLICFSSMLVLLLVVSMFWRSSVHQLGQELDEAVNGTGQKLRMAGDLRTEFKAMLADARGSQFSLVINLLLHKDAKGSETSVAAGCAACHDTGMQTEGVRRFEQGGVRLRRELAELRKINPSPEELQVIDEIGAAVDEWQTQYHRYLELAGSDRYEEAHGLMIDRIAPLLEKADAAAAGLMEVQRGRLARAAEGVDLVVAQNQRRAFLLMGLGLVLAASAFILLRSMSATLRRVSRRLLTGTGNVASASRQSAAASHALAHGASEQASSLSEANLATRGIGEVASANGQRARSATALAARSQTEFTTAQELLTGTQRAMSEAAEASKKMAGILRVIDEIAFQTNILALNAAVEAARAGEAGMGFAIVADEVRALARRCAEAAEQIGSLVTDASRKNADSAASLGHFEESLRRLIEDSSGLGRLLAEVDTGSQEQNRGLHQLAASLQRMDEVTHANAGVAEESAAAAAHLEDQAHELDAAAVELNLLIGNTQTS